MGAISVTRFGRSRASSYFSFTHFTLGFVPRFRTHSDPFACVSQCLLARASVMRLAGRCSPAPAPVSRSVGTCRLMVRSLWR